MRKATEDIAAWLKKHDRIAILTHLHPDGDALGSSLALALAMRALNRQVFVCCQDGAPDYLDMLPASGLLFLPENAPFRPDALISVDCAARSRFGRAASLIRDGLPVACVDHHLANDIDASPSLIDADAAASGELIAEVIDALGVPFSKEIALCLYVAVSTDTGNFNFSCTTSAALSLAARCVDQGVDIDNMTYRLFRMRTAARTKLLGQALSDLEYLADGKIALMRVTRADFQACGAVNADTEGIVNYGINTEGVEIAILAVEQDGDVKFSLRSRGQANVAELAAEFGGGGHECAAGVTMPLPLDDAADRLLQAARRMLTDNQQTKERF